MEHPQVLIDRAGCIGCGLCSRACVAHNIKMIDKKTNAVLSSCLLCGQCQAVCPQKAISMTGYEDDPIEKKGEPRLDPDQVLEVIRFRRSVRRFQPTPIPQEVIGQILEAGRLTHTAKNRQDVSFAVLDQEKDRIEKMAVKLFRAVRPVAALFSPMAKNREIDDHFFFFSAPLALVILAEDKTNGLLAAQNMEFVAEAHGLGVLYSGFFTAAANASPKIKKAIGVPKGKRVAMTLVLGYPDIRFLRSTPHKKLDVRSL